MINISDWNPERLRRTFKFTMGGERPLVERDLVITKRDLTGSEEGSLRLSLRWCIECQEFHPWPDFFSHMVMKPVKGKHGFVKDKRGPIPYQYVYGGDGEDRWKCYRHFPEVILDQPVGGCLRLRFGGLCTEQDRPIELYDFKNGIWIPMAEMGIRSMDKGREFRFQPYPDRHTDRNHVAYKDRRAGGGVFGA